MQGYRQDIFDYYERTTHELRITSDPSLRTRGMLGVYILDSYHDYSTPYVALGLSDFMQPSGGSAYLLNDQFYLNSIDRFDDDQAIFGSVD